MTRQHKFRAHRSMNTIRDFLTMATKALRSANIKSARLDSELLLSASLGLSREWLLAHDDAEIAEPQWNQLCQLLYRRAQHCPLAYLTDTKEFYGRNFMVDERVIIPRPESEQIIESLNNLIQTDHNIYRLIDVGTGSGCLAITAKLEHPELDVHACDNSPKALEVARLNAAKLLPANQQIHFYLSNWLYQVPYDLAFDVITANLPYVDSSWSGLSPELEYEPYNALYDDEPFALGSIRQLLLEINDSSYLRQNGYLILEMDRRQMKEAIRMAERLNFTVITKQPFTLVLQYQLANRPIPTELFRPWLDKLN